MAGNTVDITIRAIDKASKDIKNVNKELANTEKSGKGVGLSFDKLAKSALAATGVITALGMAGKAAFEFAEQGAQLQRTNEKFDRLAKSIGVTGEALRVDLKKAMGGIVSEAESVTLATDLMTLGLVKSRDEAVRMAKVAGELGMNMNQLVLTLTNQTTMRFDALGVAVDGFEEKVRKLEDAGYATDEAFRLAFVEQAEDQIAKVGSVAETAAGQFATLRATMADTKNEASVMVMNAILPTVEALNDYATNVNILREAKEKGIISLGEFQEQVWRLNFRFADTEAIQQYKLEIDGLNASIVGGSSELEYYLGLLEAGKRAPTPAQYRANASLGVGQAAATAAPRGYYGYSATGVSLADQRAAAGMSIVGHARGGPLSGVSLVGEEGPELIINGNVVPAKQTRAMLHGGIRPGKRFLDGGTLGGEKFKTESSYPDWFLSWSSGMRRAASDATGTTSTVTDFVKDKKIGGSGGGEAIQSATEAAASNAAASIGASNVAMQVAQSSEVTAAQQQEMIELLRRLATAKDIQLAMQTALEQAML